MKATVSVFTKKRTGMILKDHGFKLRNMPVHLRGDLDDELNKYVSTVEAHELVIKQTVNSLVSRVQEILHEEYKWFPGNGIEVGYTCMGYISTDIYDTQFFLWK